MPGPGGNLLAMPTGCRHAFPLLAGVSAWSSPGDAHVLLLTPSGATVLDFAPKGGPSLEASVGEQADRYVLTPTDPTVQQNLVAAAAAEAAPLAPPVLAPPPAASSLGGGVMVDGRAPATVATVAPAVTLPPVSAGEVAGNYAVLRDTRDTGCMVTLENAGTRAEARAKLAPACRDQGIVIFDPAGWKLAKGELVLMAKKGHNTILTHREDRTWATTPAKGAALVLKRL